MKVSEIKTISESIECKNQIAATNLFNVGANVVFSLTGPLHFNQSCTDTASRSIDGDDISVSGGTARTTIYGCAPGGMGTVMIKKTDGTLLNSASVTVKDVSGNNPTGDLSVSLQTIDAGQSVVITASNLTLHGLTAVLDTQGPIDTDEYCGATTGPAPPSTPVTDGSTHTYYGCVPGGTATVALKAGNYVLDSIKINVNKPPDYADFIESPGPAIYCGLLGLFRRIVANESKTIQSPGGYTHTATIEIWESFVATENPSQQQEIFSYEKDRCIEARISNSSSPGSANSTWESRLYVTTPYLTDPKINIDVITQGDNSSTFIDFLDDPNPTSSSPLQSSSTSCALCVGGTTQTHAIILEGGFFIHDTVHLFSEHTFDNANLQNTIEFNLSHQTSNRTDITQSNIVSVVVSELLELLPEYVLSKLVQLANWLILHSPFGN